MDIFQTLLHRNTASLSTVLVLFIWSGAAQVPGVAIEVTPGYEEFCSFENFNVSCGQNEVLLIDAARYGRMRIGRCVKAGLGYLDCVRDVRSLIDARCTGRRQCQLYVSDEALIATRPCPTDVTWHLEVSYRCIKVLSKEDSKCRPEGTQAPTGAHSSGFIASLIPIESHYGSDRCPWILTVEQGQRIRLVLKGYYPDPNRIPLFGDHCPEIAVVMQDGEMAVGQGSSGAFALVGEGGKAGARTHEARKSIVVCGENLMQKDLPVYLSKTNRLALALTATPDDIFLIAFEAVGCPSPRLSPRSWSERTEDKLIIGCNETDEKWWLVCRDNRWVGQTGNCSQNSRTNERYRNFMSGYSALPMSILIAVAVGVALGIFIGGALLAVVGSRMNRRHKSRLHDAAYTTSTLISSSGSTRPGGVGLLSDSKRMEYDRQYADSEELTRGRGGGGGGGGVLWASADCPSNSLRNDQQDPIDPRSTFYRQGQCSSIPAGAGSPLIHALHHHHHHHLVNHPYESPVILT